MKNLMYIVTCFLTLMVFATAEGKSNTAIHLDQHQKQDQLFNKKISVSQNHISDIFINLNDDFCQEDIDELDFNDNGSDHFSLLNFGEIFSFFQNYFTSKTTTYTKSTHQIVHAVAVPLYILFHSMIVPSAN